MPKLIDKIIKGKNVRYFAFKYDDVMSYFDKKEKFKSMVEKGLKEIDPTQNFKFTKSTECLVFVSDKDVLSYEFARKGDTHNSPVDGYYINESTTEWIKEVLGR